MNDTEAYVLDSIKQWVWSGYYPAEDVHEMLDDILEEEVDESFMRDAIDAEFEKKAQAEIAWPSITDCDRLDAAFEILNSSGICACQNTGYTMSDGFEEVSETLAQKGQEQYHGYCFFHGQDLERALKGRGLMVAFGDLKDDTEKSIQVGRAVQLALEDAGLKTEWDGTTDTRINIAEINWQRRL